MKRVVLSSYHPLQCRYFWYNSAVGASTDIATGGTFNWKLLLCLFAAWVLIYLCLFRGIESSGKVGLYIMLLALLVVNKFMYPRTCKCLVCGMYVNPPFVMSNLWDRVPMYNVFLPLSSLSDCLLHCHLPLLDSGVSVLQSCHSRWSWGWTEVPLLA